MDICEAPISVEWRLQVTRTIALPSLVSFKASAGVVVRGSRSFLAISRQRSSLARFSGVEMTAMIIGFFKVVSPMVTIFIRFVSPASFWK
jgi:hypothetical protein